jgi:hypothetical protein
MFYDGAHARGLLVVSKVSNEFYDGKSCFPFPVLSPGNDNMYVMNIAFGETFAFMSPGLHSDCFAKLLFTRDRFVLL